MSDTGGTDSLLEFPCAFPLKVIGLNRDSLVPEILAVVLRHAPDFAPESTEMRPSAGGKYVGLTCTIRATSRQQLDALYRELTSHPLVRMVL